VDYFWNKDPLYDPSANVEHEMRDVLSCYKYILLAKMSAEIQTTLGLFFTAHRPIIEESELVIQSSSFQHM
jgi:hypothetical protein